MELIAAVLCDHASVREGLLMVIGGGITRITRAELPAALGVELAVMLELTPEDHRRPHELVVDISDADGLRAVSTLAAFTVGPGDLDPGETSIVPIPVKFAPGAALPSYGRYSVDITLDDVPHRSLSFRVQPANA